MATKPSPDWPDQAAAPRDVSPPPGATEDDQDVLEFGRVRVELDRGNPILVSGASILLLAERMNQVRPGMLDLGSLRSAAQRCVVEMEEGIDALHLEPSTANHAELVFRILLDDLALNGPWRNKEPWRENLVNAGSTSAAEASDLFFSLVEAAEDPGADIRMTELLYVALALGYAGNLRMDPRGPMLLTQARERLLRIIRENIEEGYIGGSVKMGNTVAHRGLSLINPLTLGLLGMVFVVGALALAVVTFGSDDEEAARLATDRPEIVPVEDTSYHDAQALLAVEAEAGNAFLGETSSALLFVYPMSTFFAGDTAELSAAGVNAAGRLKAALELGNKPFFVIVEGTGTESGTGSATLEARGEALQKHLSAIGAPKSWLMKRERLTRLPGMGQLPNTDTGTNRIVIIMPKQVRATSISVDRYFKPAWF